MEQKKLFLLDAYALIYRAYYAMIRAPRITSKGLNTSAIYGFCNTLDEILRKENPSHIAVCFDPKGGNTFRHEIYPEYKAQRDAQPEDITLSIPYIKDIIAAYNIPVIEMPGFEADDIIGTLAFLARDLGYTTYMMTPDKDYGQLVDDRILMYRPSLRGRDFEIRGPREVCQRYGINSPIQVIDLLALEGDASDNIPGCPGVGEKTAQKLIKEWGSVENLLAHASEIKGALGKKIQENAEQIRFSKYLVTIKTDVPVDVTIDSLVRKPEDAERLRSIFTELEFRTFLKKMSDPDDAPEPTVQKAADNGQSLFDFDFSEPQHEPTDTPLSQFTTIDTIEALANFVEEAAAQPAVAIATCSVGPEAMTAKFIALAISANSKTIVTPLPASQKLLDEWAAVLQPLFSSQSTVIVGHEIKRDMILLRRIGIELSAHYFDTSVAHYLLQPEMRHWLSQLSKTYLGFETADSTDNATQHANFAQIWATPAEGYARAAEAAQTVLRLHPILTDRIAEEGLLKLMSDLELPFLRVLASMEWEGVRIDVGELNSLSQRLTARVEEIEEEAYRLAGERFNISSPRQVGDILFDKLRLDPKAKKTKVGSYSTTEEILEKLRNRHPIVGLILESRSLRKLLATYINALPELINPATGKIHTTFNQTVTATGRISSTNPNLQNIPIRTELGREIRRAFIADPGNLILSADYSQIELRLLANMSADSDMIDAFLSGEDFHQQTAAKIYKLNPSDVSPDLRRHAKTANFGIVYGISAFGLSERLGIPRTEAKALIDGYYATYPGVKHYIEQSVEHAREKGFVETIMGRKRFLPDINSRNSVVRSYAERNAVNAPLQGSAADIIKRAMIDIYNEMSRRGMKSSMIIQVHDELVFNVVPSELPELQTIVTSLMEKAFSGKVPLEVSAGVGQNWLEAH